MNVAPGEVPPRVRPHLRQEHVDLEGGGESGGEGKGEDQDRESEVAFHLFPPE
jgi:hypothetical protein